MPEPTEIARTPHGADDGGSVARRRLAMALEGRQFEIQLFWQRSLFFWGFNAAALVAAGSSDVSARPDFALAVRSFGLICALTWALANRGSKYWHEAWEQKVQREELAVVGPLYSQEEPLEAKGWWMSARRYSVSRLAMALSDYVLFLWVCLLANQVIVNFEPQAAPQLQKGGLMLFLAGTAAFAIAIVRVGRSGPARFGRSDA